jgi:hypothetical protein
MACPFVKFLGRKVGEDSVEDTHAGPANEPVVERLPSSRSVVRNFCPVRPTPHDGGKEGNELGK